jgi:hypothetical protein
MNQKAQISSDDGIPFQLMEYRPSLVKARGINWTGIWADGSTNKFKASPMAKKALLVSIVARWPNPPAKLQTGNGRPFAITNLDEERHSHVYLVRLQVFDETAEARSYYKIGKAISIPNRIKQLGPCTLINCVRFANEKISLKAEKELHLLFNDYRRPGTEIFCFTESELTTACLEMNALEDHWGDFRKSLNNS